LPKPLHILRDGGRIVFYSDSSYKELNMSVKPRKWDPDYPAGPDRARSGAWVYPAEPVVAAALLRTFKDILTADPNSYVEPEVAALADLPRIRSKTESWDHQKRAYFRALNAPGFMLALDMGTGKSKVVVDLIVNRGDQKTLIVCPKAVIDVWPKQFQLHADPSFNPLIIKLNSKMAVKEKAELIRQWSRTARPLVVIANYDIVYREPLAGALIKAGFNCVIADESHKIKAPGGKASRFMALIGRKVQFKMCLTGTPCPNHPGEIYAQYRFLDPTIFGTRYNDFLAEYADYRDQYGKVKKWKNLDKLNAKIYSIAERVKSSDVLDLPPVQHIDYYFDLCDRAAKVYDELEDKFRAELERGEISVTNAVTKLLRFAQLTGGFAKSDDGELVQVDTGKRDLFADLLEQLAPDEPAVVFCRFREDLDAVHKVAAKLNRRSLELSGRRNQLADWQSGAAPVLAVQIQSGGAGVDCTRACHVFYYSVGYSNGDYEQSLKRSDRPGQTRPVRFYHLLAKNTVDDEIMSALAEKRNIVSSILDHRKTGTEAA
jgi:SNF2 family DNA or RNA helicase